MAYTQTSDSEYATVLKLKEFGWHIELLNDNRMIREIAMWAGSTLGYRSRDLNPLTFEHNGRWDGGVLPVNAGSDWYWIAFRDEQDYLMYKLKFSD